MKISNLGVANTALNAQPLVEDNTSGASATTSSAADAGGYSPSNELQQLILLVRQQPDIREGQVQAALLRHAQGYYQTQASAERTATAILNS